MLESIRRVSKEVSRELNKAWESLADGWREILSRNGNALTLFHRNGEDTQPQSTMSRDFPRWSLLTAEVVETASSIIVRVEIPGVRKEDCHVTIEGNTLYVRGEKRFESLESGDYYHVIERAYGSFQRAVALPYAVDGDRAEARFEHGVLTITLPRLDIPSGKRVIIS